GAANVSAVRCSDGVTVDATISMTVSTLSYAATARDLPAAGTIVMPPVLPGGELMIGPATSGQRIVGSAVRVQLTNPVRARIDVAADGWSGPAAMPLTNTLQRRAFGSTGAWTDLSVALQPLAAGVM